MSSKRSTIVFRRGLGDREIKENRKLSEEGYL